MKWQVDIINGIGLQDQMLVETRVPGLFYAFQIPEMIRLQKRKDEHDGITLTNQNSFSHFGTCMGASFLKTKTQYIDEMRQMNTIYRDTAPKTRIKCGTLVGC